MRDWGTGGKYQQITQAVTGALQGVFNGDLTQALANGSAPFLAEAIKNATTNPDGSVNTEANLAAHAILGALLSQANGNSALAGGLGALTAEAAANLIKNELYGDKSFADLTDAERQNISALAQIAAAVAGGLAGDSSSDAAQGAIAGKNAVENNYLYKQEASLKKQLEFKLKNGTISELEKAQLETLYTLDEVRDALVATACNSPTSQSCLDALSKALGAKLGYDELVEILNGGIRVPDGALSYPEDYQNVLAILNGVTSDTIKYERSINSIMSNNPGMTRQEAEQRFDEIYNNFNAQLSMVLLSVAPLLVKGAVVNLDRWLAKNQITNAGMKIGNDTLQLPNGKWVDGEGLPLPVFPSVGASGRVPIVLQSGGNKLNQSTATGLNKYFDQNINKREWGRALESLKKDNNIRNDHHGRILDNGDYINSNGNVIGNIGDYLK